MTNSSAPLLLNGDPLTLAQLDAVAAGDARGCAFAPGSKTRMLASRAVVDRAAAGDAAAYGINTGFGKLADVRVAPDQVAVLQQNLVRSHCCGVGEPLSEAEVRGMLLLRANVLAKGCSGVRTEVAELLVAMLAAPDSSGGAVARLGRRERRSGSAGASGAGADRRGRSVRRGERMPAARRWRLRDLRRCSCRRRKGWRC